MHLREIVGTTVTLGVVGAIGGGLMCLGGLSTRSISMIPTQNCIIAAITGAIHAVGTTGSMLILDKRVSRSIEILCNLAIGTFLSFMLTPLCASLLGRQISYMAAGITALVSNVSTVATYIISSLVFPVPASAGS